jgi:hypothetical protein
MKPDRPDLGPREQPSESGIEVARFDVPASGGREHQAGLVPAVSGKLALVALGCALRGERLDSHGGQGQDAARASRLGRTEDDALAADTLQGLPHPKLADRQLDIRPPQPTSSPRRSPSARARTNNAYSR